MALEIARSALVGSLRPISDAVVNNLEDANEQIDTAVSIALRESKSVYINISCSLSNIPHSSFFRQPAWVSISPVATFEDEVVHLKNSFAMLEEACKELRSSRLFLKLLEAALKTGNRMNVGTIRGGAKAFKLDALLKLADVKGTDVKTTLLHFVVQEMIKSEGIRMADSIMGKINQNNKRRTTEEKEEDYERMGLDLVSGLSIELCNVKKTASIDLDVLATSVSNLSDGMAKMQKLTLKDFRNDATSSNFIGAIKTFTSHAEKSLRDLQEHENEVLKSVKEIIEYFHGEVGKDEKNLLRIFILRNCEGFHGNVGSSMQGVKELESPKTPNPLAPFH